MKDIFTDIYAQNKWNGGSGPGSTPAFCRPLLNYMQEYVARYDIKTLCDLGCGDLQWIPELLRTNDIRYIGVDCVDMLIEKHKQKYTGDNFKFICRDLTDMLGVEIPQADLYLFKDVLQHWPSEAIVTFLKKFFTAKPTAHVIAVNCNYQNSDDRRLDDEYKFAPLHGRYYPLRLFQPTELFQWNEKTLYRLREPSRQLGNP